ncbi:sulfatase-like hydrolase/transferase [Natrinema salinisoli]|uniref:sulfatase-like hydrolase/transferase n=1 Tax=Natrinema salinisoli TaxID=2878535 RepID=UPI001CEFD641|nr:sulfatase-like hydrolase/transferase [Natrinema salinisoli]
MLKTLSTDDVRNVFIYVGDAVRWDYRPQSVTGRGLSIKTVAASIHSPTSFASLATGVYPPIHGVTSFNHQISNCRSIFEVPGYDSAFVNSIGENASADDPIFSVLNADDFKRGHPFKEQTEPFLVMERGPGGHAPYGSYDGTAAEYFKDRSGASIEQIRQEYEMTVERDAELFERRLNWLRDEGILDETLVIYTSDHGELLGEGGLLGHNGRMRPELVYVPTVFVHPSITDEEWTNSINHVDILPTALDVLDNDWRPDNFDGRSLLETTETGPGMSFYRNHALPFSLPFVSGELTYEGVFDGDGGFVFAESALRNRLAVLAGKVAKSPKRGYLCRHLQGALGSFHEGDSVYGNPGFDKNLAQDLLTSVKDRGQKVRHVDISEDAEDHLRDLGYM